MSDLIELAAPGGLWYFKWAGEIRTGTLVAIEPQPGRRELFCKFTIDGENGVYGCRMSAVVGPKEVTAECQPDEATLDLIFGDVWRS